MNYAIRYHIIISPPSKIIFLNALLDSYDGIGMMRTADEKIGEVVIYTTSGYRENIECFLASLKNENIDIKIIKSDFFDFIS